MDCFTWFLCVCVCVCSENGLLMNSITSELALNFPCFCGVFFVVSHARDRREHRDESAETLPRSTIFPKRLRPRWKSLVGQFQRRFLNWCLHSEMACLAPLATATTTPGWSRTSRRCLRLSVACTSGSKYEFVIEFSLMEFETRLLGSPARAIPLFQRENKRSIHYLKKKTNKNSRQSNTIERPWWPSLHYVFMVELILKKWAMDALCVCAANDVDTIEGPTIIFTPSVERWIDRWAYISFTYIMLMRRRAEGKIKRLRPDITLLVFE